MVARENPGPDQRWFSRPLQAERFLPVPDHRAIWGLRNRPPFLATYAPQGLPPCLWRLRALQSANREFRRPAMGYPRDTCPPSMSVGIDPEDENDANERRESIPTTTSASEAPVGLVTSRQ